MKKQYKYISVKSETHDLLSALCGEKNMTFSGLIEAALALPPEERKAFGQIKYPFHNLEVGESVAIPWLLDLSLHGAIEQNRKIACAVQKYGKRTGRKFHMLGTVAHLLVTRMPDATRGMPLYPPGQEPPI